MLELGQGLSGIGFVILFLYLVNKILPLISVVIK